MKEALEKYILELENRLDNVFQHGDILTDEESRYGDGRSDELNSVIDKLKEIVKEFGA